MFSVEEATKTECHSAKIDVETSLTKLVLLAEREINWTVKKFAEMVESKSSLEKQFFELWIEKNNDLPRLNWMVRLYPDYNYYYSPSYGANNLAIQTSLLDPKAIPGNHIFAKIEVEVIKEDGTVWNKYSTMNTKAYTNKDCGGLYEIRGNPTVELKLDLKYDRCNEAEGLPVWKDGRLVFRLFMQLFMRRLIRSFEQVQTKIAQVEQALLNRFETEAEAGTEIVTGKKADVLVISRDGKKFHFHKELLIGRSPVFEAMFRSGMKESETGVVTLDDVSEDGVKFLWDFIYNGKMQPFIEKIKNGKDGREKLEQWVYVASKYQLEALIKFFDRILGTLCTAKNAMNLLRICNRFLLKGARDDVKAFIVKNPELLNMV